MIYLIDTNIISECIKKNPNSKVIDWLKKVDINNCSISVLTLGEIRKGIEKLDCPIKKQKIIQWLETDLLIQFSGRILDIGPKVADKWGYITSFCSIPAIDALIAASALVYNQKIVTRNVKDFENIIGLEVVNPFNS